MRRGTQNGNGSGIHLFKRIILNEKLISFIQRRELAWHCPEKGQKGLTFFFDYAQMNRQYPERDSAMLEKPTVR